MVRSVLCQHFRNVFSNEMWPVVTVNICRPSKHPSQVFSEELDHMFSSCSLACCSPDESGKVIHDHQNVFRSCLVGRFDRTQEVHCGHIHRFEFLDASNQPLRHHAGKSLTCLFTSGSVAGRKRQPWSRYFASFFRVSCALFLPSFDQLVRFLLSPDIGIVLGEQQPFSKLAWHWHTLTSGCRSLSWRSTLECPVDRDWPPAAGWPLSIVAGNGTDRRNLVRKFAPQSLETSKRPMNRFSLAGSCWQWTMKWLTRKQQP